LKEIGFLVLEKVGKNKGKSVFGNLLLPSRARPSRHRAPPLRPGPARILHAPGPGRPAVAVGREERDSEVKPYLGPV
jgi:hypothetical protein